MIKVGSAVVAHAEITYDEAERDFASGMVEVARGGSLTIASGDSVGG